MHSSLPSHGARRPKPAPGVTTTNGRGAGSQVVDAKINNGCAIGGSWGQTMAQPSCSCMVSGPRAATGVASPRNWRPKGGKCSASTSWDLAHRINPDYANAAHSITEFGDSKPLPFSKRSCSDPLSSWEIPLEA